MEVYYKHPDREIYQPDRRVGNGTASEVEHHRTHREYRTTSQQYDFLSNCLVRRERTQTDVARHTRRIRHALVIVAIFYIAIFFSAPEFKISLTAVGIQQEFTLLQIGAVAPLLIAYLILHACHLSTSRLRLIHECKVLEVELRKFGMPTSYGLLDKWGEAFSRNNATHRFTFAKLAYYLVYTAGNSFIAAAVVLSFGITVYMAIKSYSTIYGTYPHMAFAFGFFLLLSALAVVMGVAATLFHSHYAKRAFKDYIKKEINRLPVEFHYRNEEVSIN